jgi:hypothetical protein
LRLHSAIRIPLSLALYPRFSAYASTHCKFIADSSSSALILNEANGGGSLVEGNALVAHVEKLQIRDGARYRVLASVCFVLVTLLVAGCGAGVPPDQSREEPPRINSENKPEEKQQGEKVVQDGQAVQVKRAEKTAVGDLLVTLDEVLAEVQARRVTFASAGNTRGAKLMADAADNVQAMQAAAEASDDGSGGTEEGASATAAATEEQRAAYNLLTENREQFMQNIDEAQRCCGLPSDFLDDELREMNVEIKALRTELGIPQSQLKETTAEDGYEATTATAQQYESGEPSGVSPPSTTSATSAP